MIREKYKEMLSTSAIHTSPTLRPAVSLLSMLEGGDAPANA